MKKELEPIFSGSDAMKFAPKTASALSLSLPFFCNRLKFFHPLELNFVLGRTPTCVCLACSGEGSLAVYLFVKMPLPWFCKTTPKKKTE